MNQINKLPNLPIKQETGQTAKYKNVPKPYMDVAKGMEKQFISYMIAQMNNSVKSENKDSSAEKYYKGLMDNERADIMANTKNGIGMKDLVLDQILPSHLKQPANIKAAVQMYQQKADSKGEI
jgi:Rod binding domain-containing protein